MMFNTFKIKGFQCRRKLSKFYEFQGTQTLRVWRVKNLRFWCCKIFNFASFASIAQFKDTGVSKRKRYILNFSSLIFVLIGAVEGYLLVKGQPQIVQFALLSFTAGILLTVTVEEIIPESHRDVEARLAALAFIGGFALFALLSSYVT